MAVLMVSKHASMSKESVIAPWLLCLQVRGGLQGYLRLFFELNREGGLAESKFKLVAKL